MIDHSCVEGGDTVAGNRNDCPEFLKEPDNGGDGWGDNPATANVDEGANDDYGDLRLMPGSLCIDAGANSIAGLPTTDILGAPRILGGTVDMGAYENTGFVRVEAGPDRGTDLSDGGSGLVHIEGWIKSDDALKPYIHARWRVKQTEPWDRAGPTLTDEIVEGRASGHADAVFGKPGVYTMILEAVTSYGKALASDTMTVTVEPWGGTPPVVEAGPAPTVCVDGWYPLLGSVTDDGRPNGYLEKQWTMVSGPAGCGVEFENPTSPTTKVKFFRENSSYPDAGNYVLKLSAWDGTLKKIGTDYVRDDVSDYVTITVSNIPTIPTQGPRVYAGVDDTNENEQALSYDDHHYCPVE